jgi:hypothetical protein
MQCIYSFQGLGHVYLFWGVHYSAMHTPADQELTIQWERHMSTSSEYMEQCHNQPAERGRQPAYLHITQKFCAGELHSIQPDFPPPCINSLFWSLYPSLLLFPVTLCSSPVLPSHLLPCFFKLFTQILPTHQDPDRFPHPPWLFPVLPTLFQDF